jgi:type VI secretion system protein ImpF
MAEVKLNPSLFDKLTLNDRVASILDEGRSEVATLDSGATQLRLGAVQQVERFNESAMRNSIRRELGWLLNTVNLDAVQDLSAYPHVKTSVLNYGLPDLTGRVLTQGSVNQRAHEIAEAARLFEPRLNRDTLEVTAAKDVGFDNSIRYTIRGDITSAVRAMPVQFVASVEVETGEAVVRE